jgi:hypothetical protein
MSLCKNRPKCYTFLVKNNMQITFSEEKSCPRMWANYVIKKISKYINIRSMGENSPHLVTLTAGLNHSATFLSYFREL